jgi:hypothetical protein
MKWRVGETFGNLRHDGPVGAFVETGGEIVGNWKNLPMSAKAITLFLKLLAPMYK